MSARLHQAERSTEHSMLTEAAPEAGALEVPGTKKGDLEIPAGKSGFLTETFPKVKSSLSIRYNSNSFLQ